MLLGVFVGHMAEGVLDALSVGEGVLFLGCYGEFALFAPFSQ